MNVVLQIAVTALGSVGFYSFIQFLITRKDNRNEMQKKILKKLDKGERDNCRTQLLLLMSDYPEERKEIFTLAEYYFTTLKGDWYMTSLFKKFLKEMDIDQPVWFSRLMSEEKEKHND